MPHRGTTPSTWVTGAVPQAQRAARAMTVLGAGWVLAALSAPAATAAFIAAPVGYQLAIGASASAAAYLACGTPYSTACTLIGMSAGILYAATIPGVTLHHILGYAVVGGLTGKKVGEYIGTLRFLLWALAAVGAASITLSVVQRLPARDTAPPFIDA
jgi:hypothetical protein